MPRTCRLLAICVLFFTACTLPIFERPTPTAEPTPTDCVALLATDDVTCVETQGSSYLIQSLDEAETTFDLKGASVTLRGTIYVTIVDGYSLSVATLEGVGVVGVSGATRVVQPGAQVVLMLDGSQVGGSPTIPFPFDAAAIERASLARLPRSVSLPRPIAAPSGFTPPPTVTPTFTPTRTARPVIATRVATLAPTLEPEQATATPTPTRTASPAACVVREDWTGLYTIQRGDTLGRIAQRFGISLEELQTGNCIANPNRILAGQVLRLPAEVFSNGTTLPPQSPTPTEITFSAEQAVLQPGQCTTVRWEVDNVSAVYFEDELTAGHNARQVCPAATTDYTLVVIDPDGSQRTRSLTITVKP